MINAINTLIFDGAEQSFYSFRFTIDCPSCNKEHGIVASDMEPLSDIGDASQQKRLARAFKLKRRSGGHSYVNERGLGSYFTKIYCNDCGHEIIVTAGIGEVQPTRMQVFIDGVAGPEM